MPAEYELPHMGGSTIAAKLTARLIQELRDGAFAGSERLPAELELAEKYGVSRSVIRDVLANLEREGFVERGRGIGTVIHRDIVNLNNRLDLKFEYNELIRGAGYMPSTDSVKMYTRKADEELADRLQVDVGQLLIVCEKRILAGGRPVIYSIDHLPVSLFQDADYRSFNWAEPVFDLLEQHCGIVVDTDIACLTAEKGPENVRQMLQVPEGDALILMDEVGYYKLSYPILQTYGFYTNFFNFTILRRKF